jgi:hypothetical protein
MTLFTVKKFTIIVIRTQLLSGTSPVQISADSRKILERNFSTGTIAFSQILDKIISFLNRCNFYNSVHLLLRTKGLINVRIGLVRD